MGAPRCQQQGKLSPTLGLDGGGQAMSSEPSEELFWKQGHLSPSTVILSSHLLLEQKVVTKGA